MPMTTETHPVLQLLADALDATSGPASGADIAKLLDHALHAEGYELRRRRRADVPAGWDQLQPGPDAIIWLVRLLERQLLLQSTKAAMTEDDLDRTRMLIGWVQRMEPQRVLLEFLERLETATEDRSADVMNLPDHVMAEIAGRATKAAGRWARNDPMLGDGRDVRAAYALTLGLSVGAGMMCSVMTEQPENTE